jgi:hypothetical protein
VRVPRFWFRCLCPAAAATGALSRQEPVCMSGFDCPRGNKPHPDTTECVSCNRCRQHEASAITGP